MAMLAAFPRTTVAFMPQCSRLMSVRMKSSSIKVTLIGASGGIGQPLGLLLKKNPSIAHLALYGDYMAKGADVVKTSQPIRVLVTGAAGQIGYSLVLQVAKGDVFGKDQVLLTGVHYELVDCALSNLVGVETVTTEEAAFQDIDYAFLVGAMPRKEGMERKDLVANVKIFKSQGEALAKFSKPTVKVLMVGNPANTSAFICAKYAASKIPANNFSAMTRLDHNRAMAQVAQKCAGGTTVGMVKNVIIWGNHSSTQFPDIRHAKIVKGGSETLAYDAVKDTAWIQDQFIKTVQKRGAVIIEKRKLSSAMSASKAACDHMRDWFFGTPSDGRWVSMAVPSDGSYGIPEGLVFSFPVTIDAQKEWKIVQGLDLDEFAKQKIDITKKELLAERDEALAACK
ncbi:hypothetical protein niasHS_010273 [Heterodera schachtii]|uniref:Malate dehydrogenase n=1 Tax=Heterodera schachtii TaxID=97005 RepID=A0ABD2IZ91_HETSC